MHIKFEGYNFLNDESCSIQACKTPRKWLIGYLNVNKMHRINLECTPYLLLSPFSLHWQKSICILHIWEIFVIWNPICSVYLLVFVKAKAAVRGNCHALIPRFPEEWHFPRNCPLLSNKHCPNVSITPITAMGCRQCLPLKGKHCRKPHCRNGVVDTFRPTLPLYKLHWYSCNKITTTQV